MRANVLKKLAGAAAVVMLLAAWGAQVYAASGGAIIDMDDTSPPASGEGWTYASNVYTIQDGADITINGSNTAVTTRRISIASDATAKITLHNVNINQPSLSAIDMGNGANLTLTLSGTNRLVSGNYSAGIRVSAGMTLTINGTGSLSVQCGENAAAIGGNSSYPNAGTITINGGTITAYGGLYAAGIGGGNGGNGGTITINDGTITARAGSPNALTGSFNGAGAGIGGGNNGSGGNITINGGTVNAIGGTDANSNGGGGTSAGAGIGGGSARGGGVIVINGGNVTADGGQYGGTGSGAAGIGGGDYKSASPDYGIPVTLTVSGGLVNARGALRSGGISGNYAAGIGSGSTGAGVSLHGSTISMNGDGVVFASRLTNYFLTFSLTEHTSGIFFNNNTGTSKGAVTPTASFTIAAAQTLNIETGSVITVPSGVTITNSGTINNDGQILQCGGTLIGNGTLAGNAVGVCTPPAPTTQSVTPSTVTLVAMDGFEYQMGLTREGLKTITWPADWSESNVFTGLGPNFTCYFRQRVKATDNSSASVASDYIEVTTPPKSTPATPAAPKVESKTHNSVTLAPTVGYEYARAPYNTTLGCSDKITSWDESNVFTGLSANTTYCFYQREAETSNTNASAASPSIEVTTLPLINISGATVTLSANEVTYGGSPMLSSVMLIDETTLGRTDYTLSYSSSNGTSTSGNYNVGTVTITVTGIGEYTGTATAEYAVTPKSLTWNADGAVGSKVYDGTADADVETHPTLSGVIDGDVVTVVNGTVGFDDENAGASVGVTAAGYGIGGDDAGNYTISGQPVFANGVITQAAGTFGAPAALSATYSPTLTLGDLSLPTGYAFVDDLTTALSAGGGQAFDATYTDPSGNYTTVAGKITVNVAKATVTRPTLTDDAFIYDGNLKTIALNAASALYELGGDVEKTEIGDYIATVTLVDDANYKWATGGEDDVIELPWSIEKSTSVLSDSRVIPVTPESGAAVVAPVVSASFEVVAGPNPVSRDGGVVRFFASATGNITGALTIYDATGNVVRKIDVVNVANVPNVPRTIAAWDLRDTRGRTVPAGTYLARGTLTVNGKRERVSVVVGVR